MSREAGLIEALAATDELSGLLPVLHQHAVSAVDGRSSLLFQFDRIGGLLHATSAFGLDLLPHSAWPGRTIPEGLFRNGTPVFVDDLAQLVPDAAGHAGAAAAVLVPLVRMGDPIGVLVIACDAPPSPQQIAAAASVGRAFVLALDRARAAADADLRAALNELLQAFTRDVSRTTLAAGLETLCGGANRLFAAERTSVWLHDRRARAVVLAASSDAAYVAEERRVAASDADAIAARALRRDRTEIAETRAEADGRLQATVTIPLKGRRRALGALVMEGVHVEPGTQLALADRAGEIGRQLSSAIENVLLFDAVLRSRRELENTFNSLADLVAVADEEGRLVYANQAFLERIGRPREAVIDRPIASVVGAATNAFIARATGFDESGSAPLAPRGGQTPKIISSEIDDEMLGGTFHLTVTPLAGERERAGAVLVARDITARARLEAERTELRNRLAQSEKLAALGQFVAGIAHELNNPLQGVLGHLELLQATGAFPKGLRRDMQRIHREADRAAKIVRNLLVFAGSRRLVRRPTSVNATIARVLTLRGPALRAAGIEVVRRLQDRLPRVKADPLLLQQAVLNIVLNAEQAIGASGGRIEARTSLVRENGRPQVTVEIRDTGPGIAPEVMSRLFEPFFTTKEVGKGTGLGLAITYGIIQEHGGHISAGNHPDGGAVFTVRLPVETE